jgi:hypothetical protein
MGEYLAALRKRLAAVHAHARQVQEQAQQQAANDYYCTPLAGRQYAGEA